MASRPASLWILMGDFNWVTKPIDRFCLHSAQFSGQRASLFEDLNRYFLQVFAFACAFLYCGKRWRRIFRFFGGICDLLRAHHSSTYVVALCCYDHVIDASSACAEDYTVAVVIIQVSPAQAKVAHGRCDTHYIFSQMLEIVWHLDRVISLYCVNLESVKKISSRLVGFCNPVT